MSAAVSWSSKKQPTIALSSREAEIVAASEAAKEAISLRHLLDDLGFDDTEPTRLHVDNQSAIAVAYNPEHHFRMKHVQRRHFFVRECVENLQIVVPFIATATSLSANVSRTYKSWCPLLRLRTTWQTSSRSHSDPSNSSRCATNHDAREAAPAAVAATGGHDLDGLEASFDAGSIPWPAQGCVSKSGAVVRLHACCLCMMCLACAGGGGVIYWLTPTQTCQLGLRARVRYVRATRHACVASLDGNLLASRRQRPRASARVKFSLVFGKSCSPKCGRREV